MSISTTFISYLFIYPSLEAAAQPPGHAPGAQVPWYRPLTVILMVLVARDIQLIAPGLGSHWFGSDFAPEDWTYAQRFTYLWTELIPVLCFIAIGTLFWWMGRRVRAQAARAEAAAIGEAPSD